MRASSMQTTSFVTPMARRKPLSSVLSASSNKQYDGKGKAVKMAQRRAERRLKRVERRTDVES